MNMTEAEKHFAGLLIKSGIEYVYPVNPIPVGKSTYRPDFYLPQNDLYVEVVGTRQAYSLNRKKYKEFSALYPDKKFVIVEKNGFDYFGKKENLLGFDIPNPYIKKKVINDTPINFNGKFITIKQAMTFLDIQSPSHVNKLITTGKLKATKNVNTPLPFWEIEEESIKQYKKQRDDRMGY